MKLKPVQFKLPEDVHADFKAACKSIDTDMNKFMVQAAKKLILNCKKHERTDSTKNK